MRQLDVFIGGQTSENSKIVKESLEREHDTPVKKKIDFAGTFDREGWEALKRMQHQKVGS